MKPSEEVIQIASFDYGVRLGRPGEPTTLDDLSDVEAVQLVRPLLRYLDQQRELERRRAWFRAAMSSLVPNAGLQAKFNEYAEKAGLTVRAHHFDLVSDTAARTIAEAEREGLL